MALTLGTRRLIGFLAALGFVLVLLGLLAPADWWKGVLAMVGAVG